jgi:AraC-like DNA-binding protein
MGIVATLLPDDHCLQRLVHAVHGQHSVISCKSWSEVATACDNEAVHLAVLDLFADGRANFERVRQLKLRFSRITLVAYVSFTPSRARDLFDAGRGGVAGLIRHRLGSLQPEVRDAVLVAVTRAHMRLTSHRLADILSTSSRTLVARLATHGFPPPQKLISWGRLIVAAQMLEDRNRSADAVARILDFPSGSAFRNMCQRYLGSTPQEIRAKGGAAFVVEAFLGSVGHPA